MTLLSRQHRNESCPPRQKFARLWASRGWHAACLPLLVSGCFYLGPIPTLEVNVPPVIRRSTEMPTGVILIGPEGTKVQVFAHDDDGDQLIFIWRLSNDGVLGTAYPVGGVTGSEIALPYDEQLDGQTLYVDIDDGHNDFVTTSFPLEVLL